MSSTLLLFTLLAVSAIADPFDSTFDYCSITCYKYGGRHLLCKEKKETDEAKPAEEQLTPAKALSLEDIFGTMGCKGYKAGLSEDEKDLIVDLHNQMRSAVAVGDLSKFLKNPDRFKQPTATNMVVLKWDDELAAIAQERAMDCMSKTDDFCRQTKDGAETGQNLDWNTMGIPEDNQDPRVINIGMAVKKWFEGIMAFKTEWDLKLCPNRNPYDLKGMYAQIAWAKTTHVGCGYSDNVATDNGVYDASLVCLYKPGGNVENQEVYQEGSPGTSCPANTIPTPTYPGLCQDRF